MPLAGSRFLGDKFILFILLFGVSKTSLSSSEIPSSIASDNCLPRFFGFGVFCVFEIASIALDGFFRGAILIDFLVGVSLGSFGSASDHFNSMKIARS